MEAIRGVAAAALGVVVVAAAGATLGGRHASASTEAFAPASAPAADPAQERPTAQLEDLAAEIGVSLSWLAGSEDIGPLPGGVITHGPRNIRAVALTFDACSTKGPTAFDDRVAAVLEKYQVAATVFLGGKWVVDQLPAARRLAHNPRIELANHSFIHSHLPLVSDDQVRQEIEATNDAITLLLGHTPRLFRAPYGEYDERTVRIAESLGLKVIQWDVVSGDPDPKIPKEAIVRHVVEAARPGSIVVMHINRHGWHTAEALPEIIEGLRKKGLSFVTVSELVGVTMAQVP